MHVLLFLSMRSKPSQLLGHCFVMRGHKSRLTKRAKIFDDSGAKAANSAESPNFAATIQRAMRVGTILD
jgi:hypothetical protein